MRRTALAATLAALVATATLGGGTAPVHAAPGGITPIPPSAAACTAAPSTPHTRLACAAHRTNTYLAHTGHRYAVRYTALTPDTPPAAVWLTGTGGGDGVCGYSNALMGAHHCGQATLINPHTERYYYGTTARATALLLHEAAHGIQEAGGRAMAWDSLVGSPAQYGMEQSADCHAGAGMAWLAAQGTITPDAVRAGHAMFARVQHTSTTHGSGARRGAAYAAGVRGGLPACNAIAGHPYF